MDNMKKLVEIMQNEPEKAYDYITNYYTSFSKSELASICKELLYSIYKNCDRIDHWTIVEYASENLEVE